MFATLAVIFSHRIFEMLATSLTPERIGFESVFLILFWSNMIAQNKRAVLMLGANVLIALFCFFWGDYSFIFVNIGMAMTFFAASYLWNERML